MAKPITRGGGEWAGCGGLTPLSTLVDQTRVGRWWGGRGAGRGSHTASSRTTCGLATIQHTKREFNQHIQTSLNNWMSLQSLEPSAAAPVTSAPHIILYNTNRAHPGQRGLSGVRVYASWLTAHPRVAQYQSGGGETGQITGRGGSQTNA